MDEKNFGSPDPTLVADRSLSGLSGDASVAEQLPAFVAEYLAAFKRANGYEPAVSLRGRARWMFTYQYAVPHHVFGNSKSATRRYTMAHSRADLIGMTAALS